MEIATIPMQTTISTDILEKTRLGMIERVKKNLVKYLLRTVSLTKDADSKIG